MKVSKIVVLLVLFIVSTLTTPLAWSGGDSKTTEKRWLVGQSELENFAVKFYLADGSMNQRELLEATGFLDSHPDGEYTTPLSIPEKVRADTCQMQPDGFCTHYDDYIIFIEILHNNEIIHTIDEGWVEGLPDTFEDLIESQTNYPKPGYTTYNLYYNIPAASAYVMAMHTMISGRKIDWFSSYQIDCYYDEPVQGASFSGKTKQESLNGAAEPVTRAICDDTLDYYGAQGHWGLPRPTRLLVYDENEGWRADKPGEIAQR
ncbi:MAG: hypothetical protein LBV79_10855, partial [Candidatus Adiutrix sp.]|nr:hypothetical protein [Candidatus Adiutrix sp.]